MLTVELAQDITNKALKFAPLATGQGGGVAFLIGRLYSLALIVAGLSFFVYLIVGGLRWIASGGDKAGVEGARNSITNAGIGLVIVVAAFAVTKLIEVTLGLKIFQ